MSIPILSSFYGPSLHGPRPHPALILAGGVTLARGRVHEICGPARATLAALILGRGDGPNSGPSSDPVIWISPAWQPERMFPGGLAPFTDPGRIIFVQARRPEDVLWAMEEALRSGVAPVVLADLQSLPALTPVRRLHLAAGDGSSSTGSNTTGATAPLGLMLTPETGGAQGIESRWHMAARLAGTPQPSWHLTRLRARMAPPAAWRVDCHTSGKITYDPVPYDP